MLMIPPPKYPRKPGRILEQDAIVPTPPVTPLTIGEVNVEGFDGPSGVVTVLFTMAGGASLNNPVDAGADPAKWTAVYNGTLYLGSTFTYDGGNTLTISFSDYASGAGPNSISYSADPSDISDSSGQTLAAVSGFPI